VFVDAYPDWPGDVARGPPVTAGRVAIPEHSGLGVDLDRDALREHAR
jgi:L-alanine-DL-glutamate epimerase-like enolase superfamily enzyme